MIQSRFDEYSFPLYSKFKMLQNLIIDKFLSLKVCLQEKKIPHHLRKSYVAGNSMADIHISDIWRILRRQFGSFSFLPVLYIVNL